MLPTAYAHGTVGATIRALSIASALRAGGAEVAFSAGGHGASVIAEQGFPVHPCPVGRAATTSVPIRSVMDGLAWTGLADPDLIAALVESELAAIDAFRPDALWAEFRPTAAISAAAAGVPLASIVNWPTHPEFPPNRVEDPTAAAFDATLRRYGQPPVRNSLELVSMRCQLPLAPTLPVLEPELAEAEPRAVFIGHTVDRIQPDVVPEWFEGWDAPRGFAYLSVTGLDVRTYSDILRQTFAGTRFRVLCAIGYHVDPDDLPEDSAEVRFVAHLPALPVMARCQFVLSHAGHDTMLSTLYHGLPSLVVPGAATEREYNAGQLARLGAGIVLPFSSFRPARLRRALDELLAGDYAGSAAALGAQLRAAGGCEAAAERITSIQASEVTAW
jgi:UDP:flavonoid glycosyltransferase YjiC (YdhE family)